MCKDGMCVEVDACGDPGWPCCEPDGHGGGKCYKVRELVFTSRRSDQSLCAERQRALALCGRQRTTSSCGDMRGPGPAHSAHLAGAQGTAATSAFRAGGWLRVQEGGVRRGREEVLQEEVLQAQVLQEEVVNSRIHLFWVVGLYMCQRMMTQS